MANHKSAIKRHRQSLVRRTRNRSVKTRLRTLLSQARGAIEAGAPNAAELVRDATSLLDRAATKNVVPDERAARLKSRLSLGLKRAAAQAS
jgi:small subunit ribosomal protein S20